MSPVDADVRTRRTAPRPSGPRSPRLAQVVGLYRDPVAYLERCRRRFGPVFRIRFPGIPPLAYVTDPAAAQELFANHDALAGEARRPYLAPLVGDQSLLCLEGEPWKRQRRLLAPSFRGDAVKRWRDEITEIAASEIDTWPVGEVFAARPRMQRITLEVIIRIVFGLDVEHDHQDLRTCLVRLLEDVDNPLIFGLPPVRSFLERPLARRVPGNPLRRFIRLRGQTDQLLLTEIARRRGEVADGTERTDVLSALVTVRDDAGEAMSDTEIRDELMTLLTAGHETTATALSWAVERLVRHPDVLDRLTDDVRDGGSDLLGAVIREVLRSRPVVFDTPRVIRTTTVIGGRTIPAGWWAAAAIPLVHTDTTAYPDPHSFDPDRFMGDGAALDGWIPFGGGNRSCIGGRLALMELEIVLATLLTRRTLRASTAPGETQRVQHVTLAPGDGALVELAGAATDR